MSYPSLAETRGSSVEPLTAAHDPAHAVRQRDESGVKTTSPFSPVPVSRYPLHVPQLLQHGRVLSFRVLAASQGLVQTLLQGLDPKLRLQGGGGASWSHASHMTGRVHVSTCKNVE